MTSSIFKKLDIFLAQNDSESMSWCDGMEYEIAEDYLDEFQESDWLLLKESWNNRSTQWQGCLISVLQPGHGSIAQEIILQMATSHNLDTAFLAMRIISFYCGISANSKGEFIDNSIVDTEFKTRLKANEEFLASIPTIGKSLERKYELLQQVLNN